MKRPLKPRVLGDVSVKKPNGRNWSSFDALASRVNLVEERVIHLPVTKALRMVIIASAAIFLVFGSALAPTLFTKASGDANGTTATQHRPRCGKDRPRKSACPPRDTDQSVSRSDLELSDAGEDIERSDRYFERQNRLAQSADPGDEPYHSATEQSDYRIRSHRSPRRRRISSVRRRRWDRSCKRFMRMIRSVSYRCFCGIRAFRIFGARRRRYRCSRIICA